MSPQEAALTFDVVILSRRHQSWLSARWCGSDSRWPSAPRTGKKKKLQTQSEHADRTCTRILQQRWRKLFWPPKSNQEHISSYKQESEKQESLMLFPQPRGCSHGIRLLLHLSVSAEAAVNSGCAASALNNSEQLRVHGYWKREEVWTESCSCIKDSFNSTSVTLTCRALCLAGVFMAK